MNQHVGHAARLSLAELYCLPAARAKLGPGSAAALIATTVAATQPLTKLGPARDYLANQQSRRALASADALTAKASAAHAVMASGSLKASASQPLTKLGLTAGDPWATALTAKAAAAHRWQRDHADALTAAAQHWQGRHGSLTRMEPHRVGRALMLARDLRTGLTPAQAQQANLDYTIGEAVDFLAAPEARDHETVRLAAAYLQGGLFRALAAGHVVGVAALAWARLAAQGLAHAACSKLVASPTLVSSLVGPVPRPQAVRHIPKPQRLRASVILPDRAPPAVLAVA